MTRNYFRSRRRSRESGGNWDMGPCNDSLLPAQSIHRNRLLASILPHRPSESCHHMGSGCASSGVSIWYTGQRGGLVTRRKTRTKEQKKQHAKCEHACSSCCWALCRFSRSSVNQTRHRRAVLATLAETDQLSRCRKQHLSWTHVEFSKIGSGVVHEGTKRPSYPSVAKRIPNASLSRGITQQDKTARDIQKKTSLMTRFMHTKVANTTIDARFRCVHELSAQEICPCLFWAARAAHLTYLQNSTTKCDSEDATTTNRRRSRQRAAYSAVCQPPAWQDFPPASKEAGAWTTQCRAKKTGKIKRWRRTRYYHRVRAEVCKHMTREAQCFYV